ncbi:hypothetical protein SBRY_40710 [Actinacidiphila bryophytorum]|uniref:Uncharacterized protein n=1 Tax=Actinacidiphila bryophytorum TaxID=1436133 RepID=A0A9W4H3L4_9ACTN|nr:hypothetical protein SBRY_40710 [Actinacidiphila bryophytorum]
MASDGAKTRWRTARRPENLVDVSEPEWMMYRCGWAGKEG